METVKINLSTIEYNFQPLTVKEMYEANGELLIKLKGKECLDIHKGQTLNFKRYIYNDRGSSRVISESVTVTDKDAENVLHTTFPVSNKIKVIGRIGDIDSRSEFISGSTSNYYLLRFAEEHNIFAQDLSLNNGQEIMLYDHDGKLLEKIANGISAATIYARPVRREDCLFEVDRAESCGGREDIVTIEYVFEPHSIDGRALIFEEISTETLYNAAYIETKFNPFYFYKVTDQKDKYGNFIRECHLYDDAWWDEIKSIPHTSQKYINNGNNGGLLVTNGIYWNVSVPLSSELNTTLGNEDSFNSSFLDETKENLIPPIIDMERVKYVPFIESGDSAYTATKLIFDFHFRKRELATAETRSKNTELTTGNTYMDGWYVNENSASTIWWNGFNYDGEKFNEREFEEFYKNSGKTSDLLGYLNFTDKDVYYRKQKVEKSFIRLSFYNSKDVIEQKLLFYSTIFLDATELYGRYIRQMLFMEENDYTLAYDGNKDNASVVFCNEGRRIDSEITVTNEYDRTRSSEGFNLYLFADDIDIKDSKESSSRTIYMKVEFNHAGNGKTIPMIMWPKDADGNYVPLTIDNFLSSLYIPVEIKYLNNRYAYTIKNADNSPTDGSIRLVLFEPKLDEEKWNE